MLLDFYIPRILLLKIILFIVDLLGLMNRFTIISIKTLGIFPITYTTLEKTNLSEFNLKKILL